MESYCGVWVLFGLSRSSGLYALPNHGSRAEIVKASQPELSESQPIAMLHAYAT